MVQLSVSKGDRNCGVRPRAWYSTLPKMVRSEGPSASRLFPAGGDVIEDAFVASSNLAPAIACFHSSPTGLP